MRECATRFFAGLLAWLIGLTGIAAADTIVVEVRSNFFSPAGLTSSSPEGRVALSGSLLLHLPTAARCVGPEPSHVFDDRRKAAEGPHVRRGQCLFPFLRLAAAVTRGVVHEPQVLASF